MILDKYDMKQEDQFFKFEYDSNTSSAKLYFKKQIGDIYFYKGDIPRFYKYMSVIFRDNKEIDYWLFGKVDAYNTYRFVVMHENELFHYHLTHEGLRT